MRCPVCKKIIPENTLKCPYCKTRTGLLCKNCNTINSIYDLKCKKCGKEILKICPHCSSVNFPNAKKCRKCGMPFDNIETETKSETLEYIPNLISQKNAVTVLTQGLLSDDKKIFSISGEKGIGKSYVLKETIQKLQNHKFIWMFGKCTPLTQLTPGGMIQDMILNLYNLPNFCISTPDFKKDATRFFQNEFPEMTGLEINNLINFLYSAQYGNFEDLLINKKKTFNMLYKVFDKISQISEFILIADNFDFIDGFSFEFLNNLLKRDNLNMRFIMLYNDAKPAKGYFYLQDDNIYLDIGIAPLNNNEMDELMCINYGADDFVTKPYNPLILLARIEAVLKRVHPQKEMLINYRNIQLDVFKSCIIKDKQIIDLSKNELKIFYYLLSHQGVIISRDELMSYLWDSDMFVDDNTLTVNINRLRKKLEDIGLKDVIITKRKQGYLIL